VEQPSLALGLPSSLGAADKRRAFQTGSIEALTQEVVGALEACPLKVAEREFVEIDGDRLMGAFKRFGELAQLPEGVNSVLPRTDSADWQRARSNVAVARDKCARPLAHASAVYRRDPHSELQLRLYSRCRAKVRCRAGGKDAVWRDR
jgi:hypothetical protein